MTTDRIGLHSVLLPLLIHTESFAFFLWHIYFLKTIENFFPVFDINTRGVGRIPDSYANPRLCLGFA